MLQPRPWLPILLAVSLADAVPVRAQRRSRDSGGQNALQITLKTAVKFGDSFVPARSYRVSVDGEKLSLTDLTTMVVRATIPVVESQGTKVVDRPSVDVVKRAGRIEIIVKHLDHIYTARGVPAAKGSAKQSSSRVKLAAKKETAVKDTAEAVTELALVEKALKRYMRMIVPCADRAHRGRWETDDPRFSKCVCPWTEKWTLPPVDKDLRVHHPLAKGKSGFSFTATTRGRATDCRVWVGAEPPADERTVAAAAPEAGKETEQAKP